MGLNIKSERVHELARILSQATGKSMTAVIEEALEEKLRHIQERQERAAQIEDVLRMIKALGPPPPRLTSDHSDLCDENGLRA